MTGLHYAAPPPKNSTAHAQFAAVNIVTGPPPPSEQNAGFFYCE